MLFRSFLAVAIQGFCQGNPTGTISGHVIDPGNLAMPGVSVTVASPVLQGVRTAVTSVNGDYIVPFLPPGEYTLVGWHERAGERTSVVQVQTGRTSTVEMSLPVEDGP